MCGRSSGAVCSREVRVRQRELLGGVPRGAFDRPEQQAPRIQKMHEVQRLRQTALTGEGRETLDGLTCCHSDRPKHLTHCVP
jgi:hypothetical protein